MAEERGRRICQDARFDSWMHGPNLWCGWNVDRKVWIVGQNRHATLGSIPWHITFNFSIRYKHAVQNVLRKRSNHMGSTLDWRVQIENPENATSTGRVCLMLKAQVYKIENQCGRIETLLRMSSGVLAAQGFLIPLDLVQTQAGQPLQFYCPIV